MQDRIDKALAIAMNFGTTDGDHHKMWVIDQMVRALLGNGVDYDKFIINFQMGEDGPETYQWDEGIAP